MPKREDALDGVTNASIVRMAHKAGVKRVGESVYSEVRSYSDSLVKDVVRISLLNSKARGGKTVMQKDVQLAIETLTGKRMAVSK